MNNNKKIPVFLSHDEANKLIYGVRKDKHSLGLSLMYYGGLRVSEMTGLRISDLHLARGFMKINGKGSKERIVPINNRLQLLKNIQALASAEKTFTVILSGIALPPACMSKAFPLNGYPSSSVIPSLIQP